MTSSFAYSHSDNKDPHRLVYTHATIHTTNLYKFKLNYLFIYSFINQLGLHINRIMQILW